MFQKNKFLEATLEFIYMSLIGMTEKENRNVDFLWNIGAKHLWFDFNLTVQRRFVLERKVMQAEHFTSSSVVFHFQKAKRM